MKHKKQTQSTMQEPEFMFLQINFIPFYDPPQNMSFQIVVPILENIEAQYDNLVDMQVSKVAHPVKIKTSFGGLFYTTVETYPKTLEGNILFIEFHPN